MNRVFSAVKSDSEVELARAAGVPQKTRKDTKYCLSLLEAWSAWWQLKNQDNISPIAELTKDELQYWLSTFVLESLKSLEYRNHWNTTVTGITGTLRSLESLEHRNHWNH